MNILFLTLADFRSYSEHNIYCDLLRELIARGHQVYCISPAERRTGIETHFEEDGHLLKLRIGNTQKTGIIEKGISTVMIEPQFIAAIKKYFADIRFDLVLYSTPPITLAGAIRYVKKRDGARTYLMLKDIFPQNAVDIGMMAKSGPKAVLYSYFRNKEKQLYALSDRIGCMSRANVDFVLKHNKDISPDRVEVFPNCIEPQDVSVSPEERVALRDKYGIPRDRKVFVYGGNLGKPQGIPFIIQCLKQLDGKTDAFLLIVGSGTEFGKLEEYFRTAKPKNMKLMSHLPKDDYDRMVAACDVGLIFLDDRFTIPNFPSRLLAYMQAGLPVIACTDPNTDVGKVIEAGNFGLWCESDDPEKFVQAVKALCRADLATLGGNAADYLKAHYNVQTVADLILE